MKNPDVSREQLLDNLRASLRDVFRLRREGTAYAKLARAQGYVDGYMQVLLENGTASQKELLELVAAERRAVDGPATRTVEEERAA